MRDRLRWSWAADRVGVVLLLLISATLVLLPLYWLFRLTVMDGAQAAETMVDAPNFGRVLGTTVGLALGSLVIALTCGTALAWAAHRLPRRRRWLGMVPIATLLVPQVALVTGWSFLLSPQIGYVNAALRDIPPFRGLDEGPFDVYSVLWITIITGFTTAAFVFLFVRSALLQVHQELLDAAAASGAGGTRVFWTVVIPLIRPALLYGASTAFLLGVGQFTAPLLLGRQAGINVLSTEMFRNTNSSPVDYGVAAAYGLPIVVAGLLLLVFQRVVLGDSGKYVTSTTRGLRSLTPTGVGGQLSLVLYGLVAVVLPLAAIVHVSFSPFWTEELTVSTYTTRAYDAIFDSPELVDAITNTVRFSLLAVGITLPLSYLCARVIYCRRERRIASVLQETVVSLPLGVPGVIFGLGFLLAYTNQPLLDLGLYGSSWSMVLVYTTLMLPFTTRMQLAAMTNLGSDLTDAASLSGAGWLRRFVTIDLPLLRPALGGAAALMIAMLAQEFSASLMVRSGTTQVLSTVLFDLWTNSSSPQVAVMAVVMCVVTGTGVVLAFIIGGRSAFEGLGSRG